jgi:ABC-type transport system substrate-binding protein
MRRTWFPPLALISLLFTGAWQANASTNPRYGGTLRVELHAADVSLDPRTWRDGSLEAATDEKLAALIFDRLVTLDNYGRFAPALATDWSHDTSSKRWQFTIRSNVKFSDGTALAATDVVIALQPLLAPSLQISAAGSAVVFQSVAPQADLLEQLASGRYFVYRAAADGTLLGTGPFTKESTTGVQPSGNSATHLSFRANDEAWSGRPFLNAIDVTLNVPPLRAMFDLQLGKADFVELESDLVPRAKQANLRVWSSDPVILYGLRFDGTGQNTLPDARLREALSLALDRGTMANVLLQKQAQPAAALLPQWLSGYAFLFNVETNLERAKELRHSLAANAAGNAEPLHLHVDSPGDLPKLLGERVAVNARQAAISIQVVSRPAPRGSSTAQPVSDFSASAHLFAWHYSSLSARAELDSIFAAYNFPEASQMSAANDASTDREQLYARERRVLEDWRVLPLVEQAESIGLGANVRDWMPARWGEWHLADVWLDTSDGARLSSISSENHPVSSASQVPGIVRGAQP